MHRVGRTGRFGTDGLALTMTCEDYEVDAVDRIEKFYEIEIKTLKGFPDLQKIMVEMRSSLF